ncbi:unnamed protein product [Meloidogyne enterolobii]|uniref:Uncharacterized protein n=1 Tax=Meloidogyne enterolobii TaxID=390850 RepID=A0ACB0YI39_MELEN
MLKDTIHYLFTFIFLIIISSNFIIGWKLNEPFTGSITFYDELRYGLCVGDPTDAENDLLVAISNKEWTFSLVNDPLCDVCLKVDYNGKCITVPVRDICDECSATHAKLSKPAFEKLESLSVGSVQNATLTYVKCDGVIDGKTKSY